MTLQKIKSKFLKNIGCPDCKKTFRDPTGLNVHYSKVHDSKKKIMFDAKHRSYLVTK